MFRIFSVLTLFFVAIFGHSLRSDSLNPNNNVQWLLNDLIVPGKTLLAETISQKIINELMNNLGKFKGEETYVTLFPPIQDPILIAPVELNGLCLGIPDLFMLSGDVALTAETSVTGLSQLINEFETVSPPGAVALNFSLEIRLPEVALEGEYDMNLELNLGTAVNLIGNGPLTASTKNVFLDATGRIRTVLIQPLALTAFSLDLGFSELMIDGSEASVDGVELDWAMLSDSLQTWFNTNWNPETKTEIETMIVCSVNHVIGGCRPADLLIPGENGIPPCIKLELEMACFGTPTGVEIPTCGAVTGPTTYEPELTTESTSTEYVTRTTTISIPTSTMDPDVFSCTNRTNGFYPHPYDCAMYIGCHNEATDYFSCPPPLLYNPFLYACVYPEDVICQLSCDGRPDGFYPHPQTCALYIGCYQFVGQIFRCEPPLLFDSNTRQCNFPHLVNCPAQLLLANEEFILGL